MLAAERVALNGITVALAFGASCGTAGVQIAQTAITSDNLRLIMVTPRQMGNKDRKSVAFTSVLFVGSQCVYNGCCSTAVD
jgi:hypothetical protein